MYQTSDRNVKRPAEHGLLRGKIYTPKKVHEAISYLGVLLSEEITLSKKRITIDLGELSQEEKPVAFSYTRAGQEVYVYWLPLPVESDEPICMGNIIHLPDTTIEDPILIDTFSGTVIAPESGEWCREKRILNNVPLAIYPYVIANRGSLAFSPILIFAF